MAANHIISYTPLKGTKVPPGTEVQLVVSQGPETKTTMVPNLSGRTLEQATSDLRTSNLEVGETEEVYDDTVPAGQVVSHYPTYGTEVAEGTKVNLQISKGPDPSTQEPQMVTKEVSIPLPDTGGVVNVTVMMDGTVVYTGDVDTAMETAVPVTVTAEEGSSKTLFVYINGTQYGNYTVEFTQ